MFLNVQKIETKNLTWIDISNPGEREIKYLKEKFNFNDIHLEDCKATIQRPKLDTSNNYIFMVLLFPVYNKKTRKIRPSEVDFFISSDYLVTVHRNDLSPIMNFFNLCNISKSKREKYFTGNPATLLYEILNRLLKYCGPIMDKLSLNISSIEEHVFKGYERRMVKEILISKINIVNFRKIMQVHKRVITKLLNKSSLFFSTSRVKVYFEELVGTSSEIWQQLENMRQSITAIERTNNSLISFQLNDIIKILTTISVLILPISLLSNLLSMNLEYMPSFTKSPISFWAIIGTMVLIFTFMIFLFKKKKWL